MTPWLHDSTEINLDFDNYTIKLEQYLIPHQVWDLEKVGQKEYTDKTKYEMYNFHSQNSPSKIYKSKQSTVLSFDLFIKRSPLYIMINGVVPSFILNLVILLAFSLSFDTQIGLCK